VRKVFVYDKRAITPVLSSLLLTVVAVAAMAIATSATYVITSNLRENMSERVAVEDVWFKAAPHEVSIYLHNIGKVAVHFSAVYINHTLQSSLAVNMEVGHHGWLNIPYDWSPDGLYNIEIVTTRGTHVGGYYRAPQT